MSRYGHMLWSKRGTKKALDRSIWSTYRNFNDMYSHIYDKIESIGVATA